MSAFDPERTLAQVLHRTPKQANADVLLFALAA
jgi:hypothetical protein